MVCAVDTSDQSTFDSATLLNAPCEIFILLNECCGTLLFTETNNSAQYLFVSVIKQIGIDKKMLLTLINYWKPN